MENQSPCKGQCKKNKQANLASPETPAAPQTSAATAKSPYCPSQDCKNPTCSCKPSTPAAASTPGPAPSSNDVNSSPDTFKNPTESPPKREHTRTCICSDCICTPCYDTNKKKSCACKGPKTIKSPTDTNAIPKTKSNICEEYPEILKRKPTADKDLSIENNAQTKPEGCTCKKCKNKNCTCKPESELPRMKPCDCKVCQCKPCKDKRIGPKNIHCTCPNCKNPKCDCKPELPILQRKPCDCIKCICNPCRDPNIKADLCKPCGIQKKPTDLRRVSIDAPQKSNDPTCNNNTCSVSTLHVKSSDKVCASKPTMQKPLESFCTNDTCQSTTTLSVKQTQSAGACSNNTCHFNRPSNQSMVIPCDCPICKCMNCKDKSIPPYKPCASKSIPSASFERKPQCSCQNCICPVCVDPIMRMNKKYPCSCDG